MEITKGGDWGFIVLTEAFVLREENTNRIFKYDDILKVKEFDNTIEIQLRDCTFKMNPIMKKYAKMSLNELCKLLNILIC